MLVPVGQRCSCHSTASPGERILKDRRHGAVEKAIALPLPEPVKGAVPWGVKSAVGAKEPSAIIGLHPLLHTTLLVEEPAQLVNCIEAQRHREFLPRSPVRQPDWATELMRNYWERRLQD
jgi:hypothetical protein